MATVKFVIDSSSKANKAALADLAFFKDEAGLAVTDTAPDNNDSNILIVTLGNPPAAPAGRMMTPQSKSAPKKSAKSKG